MDPWQRPNPRQAFRTVFDGQTKGGEKKLFIIMSPSKRVEGTSITNETFE